MAIAIASVLTLVAFTGSSLPNDLGSRDSSAGGAPIVLIVLDTVRADHLELYGYERRTMPGLAAFVREDAVVVERAITNAPDSLAAHASLFTGLFPANHGAHRPLLNDPSPPRFGYPLRPDVPTIATVLSDNGYATVGVVGNFGPIGSAEMGLSRGFDIYRANRDGDCANQRRSPWSPLARVVNVLKASCVEYRRAEHITNEAITALELLKESDFFLFVNYMDAHSPYDPPAPFRSAFGSVAVGRETLNLYDGELSYLDTHLKRLLDHLREHPAWDDMVVVITSDHGEGFGEHGLLGHTTSLYDEMIRVPLVLRFGRINSVAEGMSPGSRWRHPMQLVDVMPMILGHDGVAAPRTNGRLLDRPATALRAWSFPSLANRRTDERFSRELRSIEVAGWKLIEDDSGVVELYDLDNDPVESRNLALEQPARVASMRTEMGARPVYRSTNIPTERGLSTDTIERLRSLGYITWIYKMSDCILVCLLVVATILAAIPQTMFLPWGIVLVLLGLIAGAMGKSGDATA